jgi:hypothetical protein
MRRRDFLKKNTVVVGQRNTYPHPTIPAFLMRLDFPKTASVKGYLRTLDFC